MEKRVSVKAFGLMMAVVVLSVFLTGCNEDAQGVTKEQASEAGRVLKEWASQQ